MPESDNSYRKIFSEVKNLCNLEIENARLLLSEKLTLLVGKLALTAVVFIMSTAAMLFLSLAVAHMLMHTLSPAATYTIVGAFYVAIAILVATFRRQLIIDPLARYITRVVLDPPAQAPAEHHLTHSAHTRKHSESDTQE